MQSGQLLLLTAALVCGIVVPALADAAEIRVLGTKSTQLLIEVIRPLLTTDLPVATKRKIDAGETFTFRSYRRRTSIN